MFEHLFDEYSILVNDFHWSDLKCIDSLIFTYYRTEKIAPFVNDKVIKWVLPIIPFPYIFSLEFGDNVFQFHVYAKYLRCRVLVGGFYPFDLSFDEV